MKFVSLLGLSSSHRGSCRMDGQGILYSGNRCSCHPSVVYVIILDADIFIEFDCYDWAFQFANSKYFLIIHAISKKFFFLFCRDPVVLSYSSLIQNIFRWIRSLRRAWLIVFCCWVAC
ncbi:hypothetical protein KFK09_023231 [Dendrobium nobile]|uniref:Uncharacterized protein n=1 Tax=Dendrobium nobile TaxID=94219 RepID=A0A8T3AS32_DENNO|nr:hypothetical protein KFK09_023231 [Dendrobium nobile]